MLGLEKIEYWRMTTNSSQLKDLDKLYTWIQVWLNRVYSFSYFKYGIYKPREVKKIRLRNECEALVSLSGFFLPPEVYKSHI